MFLRYAVNAGEVVHRETRNGREYLVVPVVSIQEGVLNGVFVSADEIAKSTPGWNGRPVVIRHPEEAGRPISANDIDILAASPGAVFNSRFEDGKLKFDAWLDVEKTQAVGGDTLAVFNALESGEMIEVSTGYFSDETDEAGIHNNQQFNHTAYDLLPDHLALLPDTVGACSIADGCGAPRVNQMGGSESAFIGFYLSTEAAAQVASLGLAFPEGSEPLPQSDYHVTLCYLGKIEEMEVETEGRLLGELADFANRAPIVRAQTHGLGRLGHITDEGLSPVFAIVQSSYLGDWRDMLKYWIGEYLNPDTRAFIPHITLAYIPSTESMPMPHTEPIDLVFDSVALSWGGKTTLFRLQGEDREMTDNQNNLSNQIKGFLSGLARKFNINLFSQEDAMSKKQDLVAKLIKNERCSLTEKVLNTLDEDALETLAGDYEAPQKQGGEGEPPATPEQPTQAAEPPPPADEGDIGQRLTKIEETLATVAKSVTKNEAKEREGYIARIKANTSEFEDADFEGMKTSMLQKLAQKFSPADYSGAGLQVPLMAANDKSDGWQSYDSYVDKEAENNGKH